MLLYPVWEQQVWVSLPRALAVLPASDEKHYQNLRKLW